MKEHINVLLAFCIFSNAFSQNLNNDLLVYYPLNGNVEDLSGNEFHGMNFGTTASIDRNGVEAACMLFENNTYIDLPSEATLKPDFPFSFSMWFQATEFNEESNYALVSTDMTIDKYYGAFVIITKNSHHILLGYGDGIGSTSTEFRRGVITDETIELNRWYHLITVFKSPNDFLVVLDGCEIPTQVSGTGNSRMEYSDIPGSIGRNDHSNIIGNPISYFTGKIDEFRFWSRSLNEADINILYPTTKIDLGDDVEICKNSMITLSVPLVQSQNYEWSTGAQTNSIEVAESGEYIVSVETNGCLNSDTIEVSVNPLDVELGNDITFCEDTIITLSGPDIENINYNWSSGESTSTILVEQSGTFILTIDDGVCEATDTVNITMNTLPNLNLGNDITLCGDTIITLSGPDIENLNYNWSSGENTSSILVEESGTYILSIENDICKAIDTINISINNTTKIDLGDDIQLCRDTTLLISGFIDSSYNYIWNTGENTSEILVNNSGVYILSAINEYCSLYDTISISISTPPKIDLGTNKEFCHLTNNPIRLEVANQFESYIWNNGETNQSITVAELGSYWVLAEDINGCVSSDTISIINGCLESFFLPNAISPNGDGMNDIFKPIGNVNSGYSLNVYNRFAEKVFTTFDFNEGWDGTSNGTKIPVGVYVYVIQYNDFDGITKILKGNLTLIR